MLWSPHWGVWGGGGWWGPLTPGSPAVENPSHCDFVKLRTMLVRTHMQDLKDVTRETHYENYRTQCIQSMTRMVVKERNRKYGAGSGAGLWGRDGAASLLPAVALGWPFPCWLEGLVGTLCPHGLWGQSRASSWCQGSALNAHQTRGTCIPFRIPRIPGVTPKSRFPTELAAEPSPAQCGGLAGGLSLAGGVVMGGSRGWLAVTMGALSSSLHACCGRRRQPSTLRLCCADCSAD